MRRWLRSLNRSVHHVPGVAPGTRSLQRHLMMWVLVPQLVLWAAAALFTYNLAARYANLAIDRSLTQSSRALARQVKPAGSGLYIDFPRAARDIIESDPEDQVYYMVSSPPGAFLLGNHNLPPPPLPASSTHVQNQPYFYDADIRGVSVRVVAIYLQYGDPDSPQDMLVQLAKSRASREELARNIVSDTVLPLSGLMALMSLIVWFGIRAGLAPLGRLRDAVKDRAPNDLAPLELEAAPQEVRALAKALNALLAAVHESVNAQKRFISDAAHQLRTPLAGLKSQADLALKALDAESHAAPAELHARLKHVQTSATRSAHLVNQLLTLARAEPEAITQLKRSTFSLCALAQEVTAELVPKALQAKVDLGYDDQGLGVSAGSTVDRSLLQGYPWLLREALINLINNAIRYAGPGAEVTVRVWTDAQCLGLDVDDNGPGLSAQEREHVFERFVRAREDGTGCGLGLPIVREIVHRHGGRVQLLARQPQGLRAQITFPRP